MFISKIKKHLFLLYAFVQEKDTINQILKEDDNSLNIIVSAFLELKTKNFSKVNKKKFEKCEDYRAELLKNNTIVSYKSLGLNKQIRVNDICTQASSKPIWGQFLFLITNQIDTPFFLELGTNLGVSGTYVLQSIKDKLKYKFITMEGVPKLCQIASKQFDTITKKYKIYKGLYSDTLPVLLSESIKFNIIFIDGNHKKEPTLEYFYKLKSKLSDSAIIIFDDINWSWEMQEVWDIVKKDNITAYSIDFFKWGVIVCKNNIQNLSKSHYKLYLSY